MGLSIKCQSQVDYFAKELSLDQPAFPEEI